MRPARKLETLGSRRHGRLEMNVPLFQILSEGNQSFCISMFESRGSTAWDAIPGTYTRQVFRDSFAKHSFLHLNPWLLPHSTICVRGQCEWISTCMLHWKTECSRRCPTLLSAILLTAVKSHRVWIRPAPMMDSTPRVSGLTSQSNSNTWRSMPKMHWPRGACLSTFTFVVGAQKVIWKKLCFSKIKNHFSLQSCLKFPKRLFSWGLTSSARGPPSLGW